MYVIVNVAGEIIAETKYLHIAKQILDVLGRGFYKVKDHPLI